MFTGKFWRDAAERAIRTAAQSAIAAIGTTAVVQDINWEIVGGTTLTATLLSLLMSIAAGTTANPNTASFQEDVKV